MADCVFSVLVSENYYVLLQQTHCPVPIDRSPESQTLFYKVILDYFPKVETKYPKVLISWASFIIDEI